MVKIKMYFTFVINLNVLFMSDVELILHFLFIRTLMYLRLDLRKISQTKSKNIPTQTWLMTVPKASKLTTSIAISFYFGTRFCRIIHFDHRNLANNYATLIH